jgi:hypothetical protein
MKPEEVRIYLLAGAQTAKRESRASILPNFL